MYDNVPKAPVTPDGITAREISLWVFFKSFLAFGMRHFARALLSFPWAQFNVEYL